MNIRLEGLGSRDVIKDKDQIIWYFDQMAKAQNKAVVTRYFLDLKKWYGDGLLKAEAFEILAYINTRATEEKQKRREYSQRKAKEKSEKEMKAFNEWYRGEKMTTELTKTISLN